MKFLITTIFIFLFATGGGIMAQKSNYILLEKSTMQIEGTSTIHDWTCNVLKLNADIGFDAGDANASPVQTLSLTIPVNKIESGKGGMNKKIYNALNEKKHPDITFELISSELTSSELAAKGTNDHESNLYLQANGRLTIAGTSREISLPVEGSILEDGSYKFTGKYEINMKDYGVDPPSAMFGTIKSGELVTVSFELYIAKG